MESDALKLRSAQHRLDAAQRERVRLEQIVRKITLENTRLRHAVVSLQRKAQREEANDGTAARSEAAPRHGIE
jgi:hypothetical protein